MLITTAYADDTGFHPGTVLKEIKLSDPFDVSDDLQLVHLDMGALGLTPGGVYAIVIDGIADADGIAARARFGASRLDGPGDDTDGYLSYFLGSTGTRAGDFGSGDWVSKLKWDLAFKEVFSDPGVSLGTKKNDKVDGTNAPNGQPKATANDDVINGKKGKDKVDGLGGFDTIDGGTDNDKLYGGDDGDLLISGQGQGQEPWRLGRRHFPLQYQPQGGAR